MAKYYNNEKNSSTGNTWQEVACGEKNSSTGNTWQEVACGVKIRKSGNSEYFSLDWYGAIIHGCAVRAGQNGDFISWPAFKNAQGKFVKRAYVWAEAGTADENALKRVLEAAKRL